MNRPLTSTTKDRLRPAYHRLRHRITRAAEGIRGLPMWPKPSAWQALERQAAASEISTLYRLGMEHFGILQVEKEILGFLNYVAAQRPSVVGEIGLKHGGNTFLFTRAFKELTTFVGLDLRIQNAAKLKAVAPRTCVMRFIEGSSYAPQTVHRVREHLAGRQFDLLFIDGDHEFEGVLKDFVSYYPLVRAGGLIALHDIVPDEFARTGRRTPGSNCYGGGVYRLWTALRERFPHREFVDSWEQNGFGIGVVTKPDDEPLDPAWIQTLRNAG